MSVLYKSTDISHLWVMGLANVDRLTTAYELVQTFVKLEEVPEEYRRSVVLLDAAADALGKATIANVGTRVFREGRVNGDTLQMGGTFYYVLNKAAIDALEDRGTTITVTVQD